MFTRKIFRFVCMAIALCFMSYQVLGGPFERFDAIRKSKSLTDEERVKQYRVLVESLSLHEFLEFGRKLCKEIERVYENASMSERHGIEWQLAMILSPYIEKGGALPDESYLHREFQDKNNPHLWRGCLIGMLKSLYIDEYSRAVKKVATPEQLHSSISFLETVLSDNTEPEDIRVSACNTVSDLLRSQLSAWTDHPTGKKEVAIIRGLAHRHVEQLDRIIKEPSNKNKEWLLQTSVLNLRELGKVGLVSQEVVRNKLKDFIKNRSKLPPNAQLELVRALAVDFSDESVQQELAVMRDEFQDPILKYQAEDLLKRLDRQNKAKHRQSAD